jgi:hypothetical protein
MGTEAGWWRPRRADPPRLGVCPVGSRPGFLRERSKLDARENGARLASLQALTASPSVLAHAILAHLGAKIFL